jgi:antirestriction protein ArdC
MSTHAVRARAGRVRPSLYQEITDKIIAELEVGRVPWVQPWRSATAKASLTMPKNAATQRPPWRIDSRLVVARGPEQRGPAARWRGGNVELPTANKHRGWRIVRHRRKPFRGP